ncbi:MAG: HlyD family efflux transporter periplasmic adaptor subunit, partial [Chthoniobacterales bacterium]|nr:HlyD family efflux transporter periplasmic adaptor subunit [Chthoniobacterales bacterium]
HLTDTELKAPSDGVVMTRAYEPGAILPTGTTLFAVSLLNPVWVRAYVSEERLGDIHPGMKVTVLTDSGHFYDGQIGYISPQAEFTPKSVVTPELRTSLVYRLRVIVSNPRQDLRQGMPVTVRLPEDL